MLPKKTQSSLCSHYTRLWNRANVRRFLELIHHHFSCLEPLQKYCNSPTMHVFFTYQQLQIVSWLEELQEIETPDGRIANVLRMQTTSEPFSEKLELRNRSKWLVTIPDLLISYLINPLLLLLQTKRIVCMKQPEAGAPRLHHWTACLSVCLFDHDEHATLLAPEETPCQCVWCYLLSLCEDSGAEAPGNGGSGISGGLTC